MTGLVAFGVGVFVGYFASVVVGLILTGRGEFPTDSYYDDIDGEGEGRRP